MALLTSDTSITISNSSGIILTPAEGILVENYVDIKIALDLYGDFVLPDDDLAKFNKNCPPKEGISNRYILCNE